MTNQQAYNSIENSAYIRKIEALHREFPDRLQFHAAVGEMYKTMSGDVEFMRAVIRRNFDDAGYLDQEWSGYNIPFFFVYETAHYNIKIHIFPPHPEKTPEIAAHCIHHHNNYLLTTYAFFGSGYETILFDKNVPVNEAKGTAELKMRDNFKQVERNPHLIPAWEPHIVFIPEELSATLILWTPDKVRGTDSFRQAGALKKFKAPLRKVIQALGLADSMGISREKTYQFYPMGNEFRIIDEQEYFAPTKAEKGAAVNEYSANMIFAFLQRSGLFEPEYFRGKLEDPAFPEYYKKQINKILSGEQLPDVYHRTEINIPNKTYNKKDIFKASAHIEKS